MPLTATEIYDRLTEMDSDETNPFTLKTDTTESDVQTWLDGKDVAKLETEADNQIERTAITDLQADANISNDNLSVAEVIESHNDDPSNFDASYILLSGRTVVQYFKRGIGGKEPISESDVDAEMQDHVAEIVEGAVNNELLNRAKQEFGTGGV